MKNLPFFLLPFFLFTSIITNAIGYYLCLFLYPAILLFKGKIKIPFYVKSIAFILFSFYFCFVISNFLNAFFPNSLMPSEFYEENFSFFKILFKSRLPTIYLTTPILLILFFYVSNQKNLKFHKSSEFFFKNVHPLENFFRGALWAGIIFSILFLLEYLFKIDYKQLIKFNFKIKPEVFYRPTGLLGNPLTLASMSLGFFAFFYTYFCRSFFLENKNLKLPFIKNKKLLVIYTLIPALCFLFILFLTLARTAITVALIVLILIPLFSASRKNIFKTLLFVGIVVLCAYFICDALGYIQRIISGFQHMNQNGHMDNRSYFREIYWKMFMDKPWIGNGSYWISHGLRDKYFVLLGYENLNERNFPAHNLYLEILASGGLFCTSILIYGIIKLRNIIKKYIMNKHFGNYTLWVSFLVCFCVNLLHGFTQNNFLESSTNYTYFYLFFVIFWEKILGHPAA